MSAHNNTMWHDGHLYGGASSSVNSQPNAAFDPLSGSFIHTPYHSTSEASMHAPLLAQHMSGNGGPGMDNIYDGSVRMGTGFDPHSMALGGMESLEALQRRLMVAAAAIEGNDEMKSSMLSSSIAAMQQQHHGNQHLLHHPQQHQHLHLHDRPSTMSAPHAGNAGMAMPWSGTGMTTNYSFTPPDRVMPGMQYHTNAAPNSAPPPALTGHAAAAMSLLAHNGDGSVSNMHPTQRLSLPSSPALINALNSASHSRGHTPHPHSPLTSNDVSGSESAQSAPVRRTTKKAVPMSSVGGSAAGSTRRTKFRRSRSGCMVCRKRKVKCDQDGLPCKQCRIGKRDCHYEENPPKRRRKAVPQETTSGAKAGDDKQGTAGSTFVQSPTESTSASPSRSSCDGSAEGNQKSDSGADAGASAGNDRQLFLPQDHLLHRLSDQGAPSGSSSIAGTYDETADTTDDDRANDDILQQWARSVPSSLSLLNASNVTGFDDWNSATPSTGATSLHTLDSEYGLHGSNLSSRRVTLTDEEAVEGHTVKVDANSRSSAMSLPTPTVAINATAAQHVPLTHVDVSNLSANRPQQG